ncbi:MAG: hypothetical protein E7473_06080 [Ruminococcaceae bacterium]|nr:hypothetical protein [Oscillospiraceae bacterium]
MNVLVPNYYKDFRCIADKCRHSCCIGWEIDIDCDTMEFYKGLETPLGKKIRANISDEGAPHFILGKGERCPFLEESGLCEIIRNMGEAATCDICRDHPRFRNFYENFTEMGIGLCCEEVSRVVLNFEKPFEMECLGGAEVFETTEEESQMLMLREEVFGILGNRKKSVSQRFNELSEMFAFSLREVFSEEVIKLYLSLERLDEGWTSYLERISIEGDMSFLDKPEFAKAFEQLATYFVFRHFSEGMYDESFRARIKFAISACLVIGAITMTEEDASVDTMADIARRFSSEVEYSEDNMENLLSHF